MDAFDLQMRMDVLALSNSNRKLVLIYETEVTLFP